MDRDIIIIGGGISGLTAGIYAQQNGFNTIIVEQNTQLGGLCSYWERGGFHIDNCVHWLIGTKKGSTLHNVWRNTHVLTSNITTLATEFFMQVELNGQKLRVWRDIDKFQNELISLSRQDTNEIKHFIRLIKIYGNSGLPCNYPPEMLNFREKIKILWKLRHVLLANFYYSRLSLKSYSNRFKHPLIKKMLTSYFPHFYNVSSVLFVFGNYCSGNANLPNDGSRGMVSRMVARYLKLGGMVKNNAKVTSLQMDNDSVKAVLLSGGEKIPGRFFIASCDLHYVMSNFLSEGHFDDYMQRHFITHKHLYPTYSSLNIYFSCDISKNIIEDSLIVDVPGLKILGRQAENAFLKNFNYEISYSPPNKSLFQIIINQYEIDSIQWTKLRQENIRLYREEKRRVSLNMLQILEKRFPILEGRIAVLDVTTPATNQRYCSVYMGAYMSFALTYYNKRDKHNGRVKGISNLYLAGQWIHAPGGLPGAAVTGKFAVQRICYDNNIKFLDLGELERG